MDSEFIRPAAASARFSVSRRTLGRWARFGWISTSRVGSVRLYRLGEIQRVIDANTTQRAVEPDATAQTATVLSLAGQWRDTDFWRDADLTSSGRGGRQWPSE